jgi:uridylate kinase
MLAFAEPYTQRDALRHLNEGRIVVFGCGTGCPFFTTDTAAALRAIEIGADVLLMAKNVDGVYSADPNRVKDAVKYGALTYEEVLSKGLNAADNTATALCMNNDMPMVVFALNPPENILLAAQGKQIGTYVGK